jgi:hypothetical protein
LRDGFQILANPQDPHSANLHRELQFPEAVYEAINEYYEEKAEVASDSRMGAVNGVETSR